MSVIKDKDNNKLTLVIDQNELDDYLKHYFQKHPRRRVNPIDNPVHPSINKWSGQQRAHKNDTKQKWTEFIVWYINKYKLNDYQIECCTMECVLTFPTKHRRDPDNYTHKFINDGLVIGGLLVDDSFDNITKVTYTKKYEKHVYKTEIIINIISMKGKMI